MSCRIKSFQVQEYSSVDSTTIVNLPTNLGNYIHLFWKDSSKYIYRLI